MSGSQGRLIFWIAVASRRILLLRPHVNAYDACTVQWGRCKGTRALYSIKAVLNYNPVLGILHILTSPLLHQLCTSSVPAFAFQYSTRMPWSTADCCCTRHEDCLTSVRVSVDFLLQMVVFEASHALVRQPDITVRLSDYSAIARTGHELILRYASASCHEA